MWSWLFNTQYGIINYLLHNAGILASNENWLGDPNVAMWTAIVADVWKTTSFMTLILYAGLQLVPDEIKEAAAADGAGAIRSFFSITLPLLLPTMLTAVLLRALDAYRVFDLIFVLTGGGPANSTQVLSTYTYSTMFSATQLGYGSAMAVAMAVSMLLFAVVVQIILRLTEWKFG
jgi:multiple sugar transport system permease protein